MKPKKKAGIIIVAVAILVIMVVVIAMIVTSYTDREKAKEFPEGNFTVLNWNEDFLGYNGDMIVLHDDDRNVTIWVWNRYAQGGMDIKLDWRLTPPQNVSNNCT